MNFNNVKVVTISCETGGTQFSKRVKNNGVAGFDLEPNDLNKLNCLQNILYLKRINAKHSEICIITLECLEV